MILIYSDIYIQAVYLFFYPWMKNESLSWILGKTKKPFFYCSTFNIKSKNEWYTDWIRLNILLSCVQYPNGIHQRLNVWLEMTGCKKIYIYILFFFQILSSRHDQTAVLISTLYLLQMNNWVRWQQYQHVCITHYQNLTTIVFYFIIMFNLLKKREEGSERGKRRP